MTTWGEFDVDTAGNGDMKELDATDEGRREDEEETGKSGTPTWDQ